MKSDLFQQEETEDLWYIDLKEEEEKKTEGNLSRMDTKDETMEQRAKTRQGKYCGTL